MERTPIRPDEIACHEPIAVVGVSGIFPSSENIETFWKNILEKRDLITDVPKTYWLEDDFFDPDPRATEKVYSKRVGAVPAVDFDYLKFGMPPNVLQHTDAGQLLGLVAAKALFESSFGEKFPEIDREKISVILGYSLCTPLTTELAGTQHKPIWMKALREAGISEEKINEVVRFRDKYSPEWQENSFPGSLQNVIAGRIANRFDLHGTNCVIDAACASSLAAVHLAIKELLSGDSDLVVTGGVQTASTPMMFMCFTKTPAVSPTGSCRPFDSASDGMIIGEGVGLIALRRLSDAERDGNHILAVIRGLGTSSDGKGKSIYAPEPEGQVRAIRRAYANAGYGPETVELLEAHGTGTKAGDAAEIKSSTKVFSESQPGSGNWCALGSVKSQIGHTAGAAGSASLIKAVLALHHKILPPTINVTKPTELVDWSQSPFYINSETRPWIHPQKYPRRAAISSFGFGGTNFHLTLEEYRGKNQAPRLDPRKSELVLASAPSLGELSTRIASLQEAISSGRSLFSIARDSRMSFRAKEEYRLAFVAQDLADLNSKIQQCQPNLSTGGSAQWLPPLGVYFKPGFRPQRVAFLFPGQGSQYLEMGSDLAKHFEAVRKTWDSLDRTVLDGENRLSQVVFPPPSFGEEEGKRLQERLTATQWAQPAIGATSAAMVSLMDAINLKAEMVAGHSFGEETALYYSGCYDVEVFLKIARKRGELMAGASTQKGGMLAVAADPEAVRSKLQAWGSPLVLANVNSPRQVILSGEVEEIAKAKTALESEGIKTALLNVSTAFHSSLVSGAAEDFHSFLKGVGIQSPKVPVYSNETAALYPADPESIRRKMASHLANSVRFSEEILAMRAAGANLFVEVGPGTTLSRLVEECLPNQDVFAIPLDNKRQDGVTALNHALAKLSALGVELNLEVLNGWSLAEWEKVEATASTIKIDSSTYKKKYPVLSEIVANTNTTAQEALPMQNNIEKNQALQIQTEAVTESQITASAVGFEVASAPFYGNVSRSTMAPAPKLGARPSVRPLNPVPPVFQQLESRPSETAKQPAPTGPTLQALQALLLQVVSEKTGYPVEMLNLEMNLEADLGIDSIKRVEILSTIREREPDLPEVEAEKMAELQTLGQIVEFMNQGAAKLAPTSLSAAAIQATPAMNAPSVAMDQTTVAPSGADLSALKVLLLQVVSEKTGYPVEMLNLEMNLEADLGIDSIKRVEILSTIREREPNLPEVEAEKMAELQTLGQIVEFMNQGAAKLAPAPLAAAAVQTNPNLNISEVALRPKVSTSPMQAVPSVTIAQPTVAPLGADLSALKALLLEVVSEKTGYPVEMLNLEMNLEADLGIDSIKRVEILSTIREREPNLPEVEAEKMAELQTLGQIVEFMNQGAMKHATAPIAPVAAQMTPVVPVEARREVLPAVGKDSVSYAAKLGRFELRLEEYQETSHVTLAPNREIIVFSDGQGVGEQIVKMLQGAGFSCRLVFQESELEGLVSVGALIYLGGLKPSSNFYSGTKLNKEAFRVVKSLAKGIKDAAQNGGGWFISVQDTGGNFGVGGLDVKRALRGGLAGLVKTAKVEWPGLYAKAIDIASENISPETMASEILREIFQGGAATEVALPLDGRRLTVALKPIAEAPAKGLDLDENSVLLVSGGARGVTAACVVELAKKYRPRIVLFGRSTVGEEEPAHVRGLRDEVALKRAIFQHAQQQGKNLSPSQLEGEARLILNAREVQETIRQLKAAGSQVKYFPVDILESRLIRTEGPSWTWKAGSLVRAALAEVRKEWGPISGVIHGAGVIHDKLIEEKGMAQFELVFDTKVGGIGEILSALEGDPLRVMAFFSSVAGRFGNRGQSDYAMANEVLNKIAQAEKAKRGAACRIKSINWGAWDGGMVSKALREELKRRGVFLIDVQEGAKAFVEELGVDSESSTEVMIGSAI